MRSSDRGCSARPAGRRGATDALLSSLAQAPSTSRASFVKYRSRAPVAPRSRRRGRPRRPGATRPDTPVRSSPRISAARSGDKRRQGGERALALFVVVGLLGVTAEVEEHVLPRDRGRAACPPTYGSSAFRSTRGCYRSSGCLPWRLVAKPSVGFVVISDPTRCASCRSVMALLPLNTYTAQQFLRQTKKP